MNASQIDRSVPGGRTGAGKQRKMVHVEHWYAPSIICFLVMAGPGCTVAPTAHKYTNEIHPREDIVATQQHMRLRMRALAEPLSGEIVASADRIIAGTNKRAVQREALLWQIEGVPAIREAAFRPDPYVPSPIPGC